VDPAPFHPIGSTFPMQNGRKWPFSVMCNKNSQYDWRNKQSVVGIAGLENKTRSDGFCDMQQKGTVGSTSVATKVHMLYLCIGGNSCCSM
jgi:hypothetical protein